MGWPISHSRSPRLHGYWLDHHGIDGIYVPLAVRPEALETALRSLPNLGFRGCNLTIPHKEAALEIVDEVTTQAERIGAINTIIIDDDGRLRGDNTDGFGFMANLNAEGRSWRVSDGPAVLLGAGGAARAIAVALIEAGAPALSLLNRTAERARRLASELRLLAAGVDITLPSWDERHEALGGANFLVNTTSLGMAGQPPLSIDLDRLPNTALVNDIVYTPLETGLLAAARRRGNPVVDGLGMLLHQGRPGFSAWFGVDPAVTDSLRQVMLDHRAKPS